MLASSRYFLGRSLNRKLLISSTIHGCTSRLTPPMKKLSVLLLIQLPPPIHGAAIINERVNSILNNSEKITNKAFKLNYANNFKEMHAPLLWKIVYTATLVYRILIEYLNNRPQITYIAFSPFGLGFYRDLCFVGLAKLFASKAYLHLHGTGLASTRSGIKSAMLKWMLRQSKLILISPSLYQDISKFTKKSNVTIIENCVDDPGIHKRERQDCIKILYMANLDERKGVKKAIEAFSELKGKGLNGRLVIAGADTAFLTRESLQNYINDQYPEIKEDIQLFGPAYGNDKHNLFASSDIFLYPTQHDAAPLVVLEALSHGLPVVCSAQGALPDMIYHGENGFISPSNSAKEYCSLLEASATDIDRLSISARNSYLEKYTPSSFRNKIEELFCAST